jgi:hypothetical protein
MTKQSYNWHLTRDLQYPEEDRNVIKREVEIDGIRCYIVSPPLPDQDVQKFVMFSDTYIKPTFTEMCEIGE